jgi:hypothetical protein
MIAFIQNTSIQPNFGSSAPVRFGGPKDRAKRVREKQLADAKRKKDAQEKSPLGQAMAFIEGAIGRTEKDPPGTRYSADYLKQYETARTTVFRAGANNNTAAARLLMKLDAAVKKAARKGGVVLTSPLLDPFSEAMSLVGKGTGPVQEARVPVQGRNAERLAAIRAKRPEPTQVQHVGQTLSMSDMATGPDAEDLPPSSVPPSTPSEGANTGANVAAYSGIEIPAGGLGELSKALAEARFVVTPEQRAAQAATFDREFVPDDAAAATRYFRLYEKAKTRQGFRMDAHAVLGKETHQLNAYSAGLRKDMKLDEASPDDKRDWRLRGLGTHTELRRKRREAVLANGDLPPARKRSRQPERDHRYLMWALLRSASPESWRQLHARTTPVALMSDAPPES